METKMNKVYLNCAAIPPRIHGFLGTRASATLSGLPPTGPGGNVSQKYHFDKGYQLFMR